MIETLKAWFERMGVAGNKRKILDVQQFAHTHRNYLVMVFDPKDDTMFCSFRDKQISAKIKSADGFDHHVVKNVLKLSTFDREVDRLVGSILDTLKFPIALKHCSKCDRDLAGGYNFCGLCGTEYVKRPWIPGSTFVSFIDGAVHNIAKAIFKAKKA
jgi:hypothetical protein